MSTIYIAVIGVVGFIATTLLTAILIPTLIKAKAGQNIREDGPESHLKKAGTPSMGGIAIIGGVLLASIIGIAFSGGSFTGNLWAALCGFVLFGMIGFLDDYLKVVKKQNLGLRAWQKFGFQLLISLAFAFYISTMSPYGTQVYVPFWNHFVDFGGWFIPFIVFTILAMVNGINLTDGLDGLAAGVTAIVALFFVMLAVNAGAVQEALIYVALSGGCLGFLVFNRHPAKVFMGDTGSLALGGAVALTAIVMKMELFLPIVGIIYVLEALSVVLQVGYFKASGGKRLFKMAPLHHHFEKSGLKETVVVLIFWLITLAFCFIAMLSI